VKGEARLRDLPVVAGFLQVDDVVLDRDLITVGELGNHGQGHPGARAIHIDRWNRADLGTLPDREPAGVAVANRGVERRGAASALAGELEAVESVRGEALADPPAVPGIERRDVGARGRDRLLLGGSLRLRGAPGLNRLLEARAPTATGGPAFAAAIRGLGSRVRRPGPVCGRIRRSGASLVIAAAAGEERGDTERDDETRLQLS
jgi:hypothetical protein